MQQSSNNSRGRDRLPHSPKASYARMPFEFHPDRFAAVIRALATANFTYALPLSRHTRERERERGSMNNSPCPTPRSRKSVLLHTRALPATQELPVNPPCIDVAGKFSRASPLVRSLIYS